MSSIGQGSISIDDSIRIGENAQHAANKVAGNVNDINSDNKLTPSEKIKLKQEYDKDVKLYNIDIGQLKSVNLPTAELDTAMSNLTDFVTPLFKEMDITSTVDRNALDSVFTAFATADKNASQAFVNMVQQVADDAKKAGDDAKEAGQKAQEAGEDAKASANQAQADATQAKADAATAQQKAQSSIDQLNEATTKFDGEITSAKNSAQQAKTDAATAQQKAQSSIDQLNAATKKFDGEITEAQNNAQKALDNITVVDSKVDKLSDSTTAQFNTLNNGYQEVISSKVSNADFNNLKISNRNLALGTATAFKMTGNGAWNQGQTGYGFSKVIPQGTVVTVSFDVSSTDGVGTFMTQFNGFDSGSDWQLVSSGDLINGTKHMSVTLTAEANHSHIYFRLDNATGEVTFSNFIISESSKEVNWSPAPEDLASQTQITTLNNLINQKVSNDQYQSDKTQTANMISSKVESKDFQTLQTQVNNSSVGTNLVKDSGLEFFGKAYGFHSYNLASIAKLTPGETYTVSFSAKVDDKAVNCKQNVFVVIYNPSWGWGSPWFNAPISTDYQRVTGTFTVPEGITDANCISAYLSHPVINGTSNPSSDNSDVAGTGYIKEFKLEKGSVATDWCLNPADNATKSQIIQLSDKIEQKVDSGDFSSYKTETANLIGSKVANSDFSSYKTETANLIGSKVESKDFESYKTQTDKEFSSTIEAVKTQVNNSAVGTNLFVGTKDFDNLSSWADYGGWNIVTDTYNGLSIVQANQDWNGLSQYTQVSAGETYTFSIYARYVSGTGTSTFYTILNNNPENGHTAANASSNYKDVSLTSNWQRVSITFTITSNGWIKPRIERTSANQNTLQICGMKLEKGSVATDWCPNPLDQATKSQITQLSGEIKQKVDSGTYQSDKTQTANLISQTVSSAVDGLKIGGTNLVPNSGMMQNTKGWSTSGTLITTTHPFYHNGKDPIFILSNAKGSATDETVASNVVRFNVKRNTTYTMSVITFATINTVSIDLFFLGRAYGSTNGYDNVVQPVVGRKVSPSKAEYITATFNTGDSDEGYFRIDNNGTTDGKQSDVYFTEVKVEEGTKATPWTPAPEDLATSTEIDQINNAIKLKADSTDVTSQITVATEGIQNEVNNKVADLTTKVSQTDSAWRASVSTLGTTNMVYNGGFAHGVDGWDTQNGKWTWSNQVQDQVQGNNAIQAGFTDLTDDKWNNTASKPFLVLQWQKMSIGAIVTPWVLDSDPKKGFGIGIDFYTSKDGTGIRNDYHPEQWIYTTGRHQLKVENITVPDGANSAVVRLYIQRNGGANFTCVQANMTPTLPQFIDGFATATDITASINNINLKVSNSDGSSSQVNINNNTILLDANKIILSGNTSIQDGTIGTAKIANAAINTAQIADGAINNAKIANAAIDDAKISNLNGNKIIAGSIAANKINVDDLIANGINTKTLTSVNLNTSTLTTPKLDLGFNGTFTEDFDYTQDAGKFLPKKNKGTLTFNHGVLQSAGNMQTYVNGQWGGMNDSLEFQSGITNEQWTEVAPGYIKMDLCKQDGSIGERIYADPTGYYYTSAKGNKSYLGNILQISQVQTPSLLAKYIGPSEGELRLQIGNNGNHYGLQVGLYAGAEAVLSDFIYDFTSSASSNVRITDNGHLARSTSASKYKYNIKNPDIETTLGDRLLNVHMATWNDKHAVDTYAEQLTTGETREKLSIKEYYGLIAEQLRDAGLDMFIDYGKNHEIEGIQYDRAWVPLLSVVRRLNDKVNEYELRLSKLEGGSK